MKKSEPRKVKFTVIIPTRERCDVLKSALETCITQEYDDLEIIISDNASVDKTREVVESFKDKRVRYINTGKRVSMTDNWEFALAHVSDGFITFIGDDDGLIPGALLEVGEIINQTGCDAVSCKTAIYSWPEHINEPERNILRLSLGESFEKRNCKAMLDDVINFRRDPYELPLLYRGFVSDKAVKKVSRYSGKFFHSVMPDIYSAVALASTLESYCYSFKPYVISGASCHSTGAVNPNLGNDHGSSKKFHMENTLTFHNKLAFALSGPIVVAESFLQAQEYVPEAKNFKIDIKKCVKAAIIDVRYSSSKRYDSVVEAVKKIGQLNQVEDYTKQVISSHKNFPTSFRNPVLGVNIVRRHLVLNCAEFGVRNVYEAALLCRCILVLRKCKYLSFVNILKTTLLYIKREVLNSRLVSLFLKYR